MASGWRGHCYARGSNAPEGSARCVSEVVVQEHQAAQCRLDPHGPSVTKLSETGQEDAYSWQNRKVRGSDLNVSGYRVHCDIEHSILPMTSNLHPRESTPADATDHTSTFPTSGSAAGLQGPDAQPTSVLFASSSRVPSSSSRSSGSPSQSPSPTPPPLRPESMRSPAPHIILQNAATTTLLRPAYFAEQPMAGVDGRIPSSASADRDGFLQLHPSGLDFARPNGSPLPQNHAQQYGVIRQDVRLAPARFPY